METTRRNVLKGTAAIGAASLAGCAPGQTETKRPNFLFIMADDLGWADLSCYGQDYFETPELDRLASEGVRFTHGYANSAVCSATRVGLITGRYQYRLPVGLEEPLVNRAVGLPPEHPTIASLLRESGYTTSLVGKWHMGALPDFGPLKSGYDHFWGVRSGSVDYFTHAVANQKDLWDGTTPVETVGYLTDLLADRAIDVLEENSRLERPFMMSLHFTAPHWPWEGPDDQAESERLAQVPNPLSILHYDGGSLDTYAEMVTRMDQQIGRVLQKLRDLNLEDDTVIVFTSDNGGERFSRTWPLSGKKSELLEGGIRVPMIVRWPGQAEAGTVTEEPAMSMDWTPTFLSAAGVEPHPDFPFDGVDLTPAIAGGTLPERPLFWRYKALEQEAVRLGDWKYLKIADNTFLFNLAEDEMERANVKNLFPEKYQELVDLWNQWQATMLPLDLESFSGALAGEQWVDRNEDEPLVFNVE